MKDLFSLLPVLSAAALFCLPLTYQCNRVSALENDVFLYQKALRLNVLHLKQKQKEEQEIKHAYETLFNEIALFYELDPSGAGDWGRTAVPLPVAMLLRREDGFPRCAAGAPAGN